MQSLQACLSCEQGGKSVPPDQPTSMRKLSTNPINFNNSKNKNNKSYFHYYNINNKKYCFY